MLTKIGNISLKNDKMSRSREKINAKYYLPRKKLLKFEKNPNLLNISNRLVRHPTRTSSIGAVLRDQSLQVNINVLEYFNMHLWTKEYHIFIKLLTTILLK